MFSLLPVMVSAVTPSGMVSVPDAPVDTSMMSLVAKVGGVELFHVWVIAANAGGTHAHTESIDSARAHVRAVNLFAFGAGRFPAGLILQLIAVVTIFMTLPFLAITPAPRGGFFVTGSIISIYGEKR
jgi:hypothetical protein